MNKKLIAVISVKGGVGKTTTAAHLAGHLASRGEVIGVDGDDRVRSLSAWASGGALPYEVMSMTEAASTSSRYLVIDAKGSLPDVEIADLARGCHMIVMPASPELMSLDGLRRTVDVIREVERAGKLRAQYAALLTMTRPGTKLLESRRVLAALGIPVLESAVRTSEAFKDASSRQVLVRDVRTNTLAADCWRDYGRVTDEVLAMLGEVR